MPDGAQPVPPRTAIQAIDRGVALLDAIADAGPQGIALTALAEQTGLAASTARTLLTSLIAHGLVAQGGPSRRYLLGGRFFELTRRYITRSDLSAVAAPVLRSLWERTEETVHLAVLQGSRRVDISVLVSPQLLTIDPTSTRIVDVPTPPIYRTAAGKVLFAGLSRAERLAMLHSPPWRDDMQPDRDELMNRMDEVVAQGYATNIEEEAAGVCGVPGAGIYQGGGPLAARVGGLPGGFAAAFGASLGIALTAAVSLAITSTLFYRLLTNRS
jgi:DNA-binding IclR family transcriptional regulator